MNNSNMKQLRQEIESIKIKVKKNFVKINSNLNFVENLLKESHSEERCVILNSYYTDNVELLKQNNAYFKIQTCLMKILKIREKLQKEKPYYKVYNFDIYLKETIEEKIPFNPKHPYYRNLSFIDKLLDHFEQIKDYQSLISHNSHFIKIKKNLEKADQKKAITLYDKYLSFTIKKKILFDNEHPYFTDESFKENLLKYFIKIEDYEMCAFITR